MLDKALQWYHKGYNVLPFYKSKNGAKALAYNGPVVQWHNERQSIDDVHRLFENPKVQFVAIICNDKIAAIDFDKGEDGSAYSRYLKQYPKLKELHTLTCTTPNGGHHILFEPITPVHTYKIAEDHIDIIGLNHPLIVEGEGYTYINQYPIAKVDFTSLGLSERATTVATDLSIDTTEDCIVDVSKQYLPIVYGDKLHYPSMSEARMALIGHLVHKGVSAERIAALFLKYDEKVKARGIGVIGSALSIAVNSRNNITKRYDEAIASLVNIPVPPRRRTSCRIVMTAFLNKFKSFGVTTFSYSMRDIEADTGIRLATISSTVKTLIKSELLYAHKKIGDSATEYEIRWRHLQSTHVVKSPHGMNAEHDAFRPGALGKSGYILLDGLVPGQRYSIAEAHRITGLARNTVKDLFNMLVSVGAVISDRNFYIVNDGVNLDAIAEHFNTVGLHEKRIAQHEIERVKYAEESGLGATYRAIARMNPTNPAYLARAAKYPIQPTKMNRVIEWPSVTSLVTEALCWDDADLATLKLVNGFTKRRAVA